MPTLFTRIIDGDLPGTFVWEDDRCVAFLSINPIKTGHTLIVPRQEVEHWLDCNEDLRDHLFGVAHTIGRAIDDVWRPEKVGLMLAGLEVPHVHIHVLPIWDAFDLDFAKAAQSITREQLDDSAGRIRDALRSRGADHVVG